jgi:hypothetical protein
MEVLEPSGSSVQYNGEQLEIRPLAIGAIPKLLRAARPVIDAVLLLEHLPDENSDEMVTLVLDLIEKHDDKVFEAAAVCTGKQAAWLQEGQIDEFHVLVKTVVEVNRDFFVQRLAPLLGGRAGSIAMRSGGGPTPSSSSSSTDTGSTTSADTPSGNSTPSAAPAHGSATGS